MSNIILSRTISGTTYKYKVDGALEERDRLTHTSPMITRPFGSPEDAIVNNVFGQTRSITGSFIITYREDDFADGTYPISFPTYTPEQQKEYLMDIIFSPRGTQKYTDENDVEYSGRFTEFEVTKSGDDPLKYDCTFKFDVGRVLF